MASVLNLLKRGVTLGFALEDTVMGSFLRQILTNWLTNHQELPEDRSICFG